MAAADHHHQQEEKSALNSLNSLDLKTAAVSGTFEGFTKEDLDKFYYQNVIEATAGPKKKGSFQITSVTSAIHTHDLKDDNGEDSQDDLDETHTYTEDVSSLDWSRTTDVEQDRSPPPFLEQDELSLNFQPIVETILIKTQTSGIIAKERSSSSDNQSRFRVVKIETREPFKRGRWTCFDYLTDGSKHDVGNIVDKELKDHVVVTGSETSSASSSIHYVHGVDDPSKNPLMGSSVLAQTLTLMSPNFIDNEQSNQLNGHLDYQPHSIATDGQGMSTTASNIPSMQNAIQKMSPDAFQSQSLAGGGHMGNVLNGHPGVPPSGHQVLQPSMLSGSSLPLPGTHHQPAIHQPNVALSSQHSSITSQPPVHKNSTTKPLPGHVGQTMLASGHGGQLSSLPVNGPSQISAPNTMNPVIATQGGSIQNPGMRSQSNKAVAGSVIVQPPVAVGLNGNSNHPVSNYSVVQQQGGGGVTINPHNQPPTNITDYSNQTNTGQTSLMPTISATGLSDIVNVRSKVDITRQYLDDKPLHVPRTHRISTGTDDLCDDLSRAGASALLEQIVSAGIPGALGSPTKVGSGEESGSSTVAIDNKIEQAMDLVKSHLMFAVREEVEVLREQIKELEDQKKQLEMENSILKSGASVETLAKLVQTRPPLQNQAPSSTSSS